jgi:hypothetical protein
VLEQQYALKRISGESARHGVILTDAAGSGPHTITPGQLTAATATGLRFSNIEGGTLSQSGTLLLTFEAERRGALYNVGVGAINLLLTSLPGVGVSNIDGGDGTSIIRQGADRETDSAAQSRAGLRWQALGIGRPEAVYELAARNASSEVRKVFIDLDDDQPGFLNVYVAGAAGSISPGAMEQVQAALVLVAPFGIVPNAVDPEIQSIAIAGTIYVRTGLVSQAMADVTRNLSALFQGGINSIGEELPGLPIGKGTEVFLYQVDVIEQIQVVRGVRNVVLSSPLSDVVVTHGHVAVASPAPTFSVVEV